MQGLHAMDVTTSLGLLAGLLTTLAYLPQVLKTWRSRSAEGMSWTMLVILCLGITLWLVYGLYSHDVPVICANVVTLVFAGLILTMKVCYEALPKLQARSTPWRADWTADHASLLEGFSEQDLSFLEESVFNPMDAELSSPLI